MGILFAGRFVSAAESFRPQGGEGGTKESVVRRGSHLQGPKPYPFIYLLYKMVTISHTYR